MCQSERILLLSSLGHLVQIESPRSGDPWSRIELVIRITVRSGHVPGDIERNDRSLW